MVLNKAKYHTNCIFFKSRFRIRLILRTSHVFQQNFVLLLLGRSTHVHEEAVVEVDGSGDDEAYEEHLVASQLVIHDSSHQRCQPVTCGENREVWGRSCMVQLLS